MGRRHYINNAPQRTLSSGITNAATTLTVSSFSGWPVLTPFYATLELGTAAEEIVLVTNIAGSTATVTRGQDGTTAVSHLAGATLDFTVGAADFDESNAHVNSSSSVHGVSGSVVGTSDVQTLSNKTLTAPVLSGTTASGPINATGAVAATGALTGASLAVTGLVRAVTAAIGTAGTEFTVSSSGAVHAAGALDAASVAATGAVTAASAAITGTITAALLSGALVVTKDYTTEGLAVSAAPPNGSVFQLSAPTNVGHLAGLYTEVQGYVVPLTGSVAVSGQQVGLYDNTKPLKQFIGRIQGTSNASGLITLTLPETASAVITTSFGAHGANTLGNLIFLRADLCTTTQVVWQTHTVSTGAAVASSAYDLCFTITYQPV